MEPLLCACIAVWPQIGDQLDAQLFSPPHSAVLTPANTQPEFPFLTSQTSDFYAYRRSGVKLAPVWRLWPARGVGHWRAASPSGRLPRELRRAHPPPLHLGTAPIPSKPTYISPFVAFYQIASSLRKWKSGIIYLTNTTCQDGQEVTGRLCKSYGCAVIATIVISAFPGP